MTTDFDVVVPAGGAGPHLLGSCHTVPFPPEVNYSFVNASATKGTIVMTALCNGIEQRHAVRPVSPLYDLDNPACSGNLLVPLRQPPSQSAVAIITFCNDSQDDGEITVLAGSFRRSCGQTAQSSGLSCRH